MVDIVDPFEGSGSSEIVDPFETPKAEPPKSGFWEDIGKASAGTVQSVIGGIEQRAADQFRSPTKLQSADLRAGTVSDPVKAGMQRQATKDLREGAAYEPQRVGGMVSQGLTYGLFGPYAPLAMANTGQAQTYQELSYKNVDPNTAKNASLISGGVQGVAGATPMGRLAFGEGAANLLKSVPGNVAKSFGVGASQEVVNDEAQAKVLNDAGYSDLANSMTDDLGAKAVKSGMFMTGFHVGMQGAHHLMGGMPQRVTEAPAEQTIHEPSSEQAAVDATQPAPVELGGMAINPYDVGGHVSALEQGRQTTVDSPQGDLFSPTPEQPPVQEQAAQQAKPIVEPKPEDLVTPEQRQAAFAKYGSTPKLVGDNKLEVGTTFGGKVYNHAPGADPLSNEKLAAAVNKIHVAEADKTPDLHDLEHAIIGAAHESGMVPKGSVKPSFVESTIKDLNLAGAQTFDQASHFIHNHLEEMQGKKGVNVEVKRGFYEALLKRLPDVSNDRKGEENGRSEQGVQGAESTGSESAKGVDQRAASSEQPAGAPGREAAVPSNGVDAVGQKGQIEAFSAALPDQQRAVFDLLRKSADDGTLSNFIDTEGTWHPQQIGDALGIQRQSARKAIMDLRGKLDSAAGGGVKEALAARTKAVRTNIGSDHENIGLNPKHQAQEVDVSALHGNDEGAEQSMGVIDSVGGSQSEVGKSELPPGYKDSVEPSNNARQSAVETRTQFFNEVEADFDESTMDGDVRFKDLPSDLQERYIDDVYEPVQNGAISAREAARKFSEIADEANQRTKSVASVEDKSNGSVAESTKLEERSGSPETDAGVQAGSGKAEDSLNPIERRVAELSDQFAHEPVLRNRLNKLVRRYSEGDIELGRLRAELDTLAEAKGKFSVEGDSVNWNDVLTVDDKTKKELDRLHKLYELYGGKEGYAHLEAAATDYLRRSSDFDPRYGFRPELASVQKLKRASDAIFAELSAKSTGKSEGARGLSAEAPRSVQGILGFIKHGYETRGELVDIPNYGTFFRVEFRAKDVSEVGGHDDSPLLTVEVHPTHDTDITSAPHGDLVINGPKFGTEVYKYLESKGYAEKSKGQGGKEALRNDKTPYTNLTGDAPGGTLPLSQVNAILADAHARLRLASDAPHLGISWARDTGATGSAVAGITKEGSLHKAYFSSGDSAAGGRPVADVSNDIRKYFFSPKKFNDFVQVVKNPQDASLPKDVANAALGVNGKPLGYFDGNKVYLFADNFPEGRSALGIAMHEVGVHMGMKNFLGEGHYGKLVDQMQAWALERGTKEGDISRKAMQRVRNAEKAIGERYDQDTFNEEHMAYFVEEAIKDGFDPAAVKDRSPIANWFRTLVNAAKQAVRKLGVNPEKLTVQDVVDMAYGSAHDAMRAEKPQAEGKMSVSDEEKKPTVEKAKDMAERVAGPVGRQIVADTAQVMKKVAGHTEFLHNIINRIKDKIPAANDWYQHVLAQQETRNTLAKKAEAVAGAAGKLTNKQYERVNNFISDSTKDQKWGYQPSWKSNPVEVDRTTELKYKQLSPAEKDVVDSIFKHGEQTRALKKDLFKKLGVSDIFSSQGELKGPYAPLRRVGSFLAIGKSKEFLAAEKAAKADPTAENKKRVDELKGDEKHYYASKHETMGMAELEAKKLAKQYAFSDSSEEPRNIDDRATMDHKALSRVMSAIKVDASMPKDAREAMEQTVKDLYATTAAQYDARQSGMKRKNAAGYDKDMIKSFLNDARSQAAFVASLKHGGDVNTAFYKMQEGAKDLEGHRNNQSDINLVNEHYAKWMKGRNDSLRHDLDNAAVSFTTAMQLSTSLGYHLNNAMQGIMYSVPHMAGTFGDYGAAWKHFSNGYKQMAEITKNWGTETDLSKVKDPQLRDILQHAEKQGLLDVGMEENLGHFNRSRTGYAPVDTASKAVHSAMHKLRIVASSVERWNRVSSATAAYNLAKEKGWSHDKAKQYAIDVLGDTQGNFSGIDAPLVLKKLPKVTGQYRKFQLMSAGFYTRAFKQAFAGASTEEKAIGARMLKFKLFHTSVAAGLLGMPLANVANMVYNAVKDSDEPDDMETKLRDWIGDKDVSDLLLHGALSETGMDMSSKLGEDKTFSILPYTDVKLDSKKGVDQTLVEAAGGPAVSQLERMAEGVGFLEQGDLYKGVEKFAPKGMESAMKAFRMANEGYTLKNGDVMVKPEDISGYALALQALGLPPTEINDFTHTAAVQYEVSHFYSDQTKQLEKDYIRAHDAQDSEKMTDLRQKWMDLQDSKDEHRKLFGADNKYLRRQPLANLLRAPMSRDKRQSQEQGSMAVN